MLEAKRDSVRKRLIKMYKAANAGHVGCSLSCLEMIVFIKFELMKEGDEFILSKGHAAALLYSVLAEEGVLPEKEIETFKVQNKQVQTVVKVEDKKIKSSDVAKTNNLINEAGQDEQVNTEKINQPFSQDVSWRKRIDYVSMQKYKADEQKQLVIASIPKNQIGYKG